MEDTQISIRVQDVFYALLKKWWLIVLSTIFGAGLFFTVSYMNYVPQYWATAKMYVNNDSISIGSTQVSISSSDISASQSLVNTYSEILLSRLTLEDVIKEADLDYTYEQLVRMVNCGSVNGTEILYITVFSTDPDEAKLIANTIVKVLPDEIATIIDGSSVKTVDEAVRGKVVSPGFTQKSAIGAFFGLLFSCFAIFVLDILINDTLDSEEWLLSAYNDDIPLLAVIPDVDSTGGNRYGRYKKYYSESAGKQEDRS